MNPTVLLLLFCLLVLASGCRTTAIYTAPETVPDDRSFSPRPASNKLNLMADSVDQQFTLQIDQSLDLSRQLRNLLGKRKAAMNVDAFDEVLDSSWFTNRNFKQKMTCQEILQGPDTGPGPDRSGIWTIERIKEEGVTIGFNIIDRSGDRYVLKFDPQGYAEMQSGAEVISTKFFFAAGYNVPENYIVYFDPKILKLGKRVEFRDRLDRKRLVEQKDLDEILSRIEHHSDGRLRATASKYLSNEPDRILGPFKYSGMRRDDPNDFIPHEHRRELRGLRVLAAWLNHYDSKATNTLDVYIKAGYVRHYLIDFGSTLGSAGFRPMPPETGFENYFDTSRIFLNLLSLGFWVKSWEHPRKIEFRSIGNISANNFNPQKFKFIVPNPAFDNLTDRDGYWGAKLVMSFTDEQIKAAITAAQYSDPQAADYLCRTLMERRDIIGRFWFKRMAPLDRFDLRPAGERRQMLFFSDLAVVSGLEKPDEISYRYELKARGKSITKAEINRNDLAIILPMDLFPARASSPHIKLMLQKKRRAEINWSPSVNVYCSWDQKQERYTLMGIEREGK